MDLYKKIIFFIFILPFTSTLYAQNDRFIPTETKNSKIYFNSHQKVAKSIEPSVSQVNHNTNFSKQRVFVSDLFTNTVSSCKVNSKGAIVKCKAFNPNNSFKGGPVGLALRPDHTLLYVVNNGNLGTGQGVSICKINSELSIENCVNYVDKTFNGPIGIAINWEKNLAYIVNRKNNSVSICPLTSEGTFKGCKAYNPDITFSYPEFILFNKSKKISYINNFNNDSANGSISVCKMHDDGSFAECTNHIVNKNPTGISFYSGESKLSVVYYRGQEGTNNYITSDGDLNNNNPMILNKANENINIILNKATGNLYITTLKSILSCVPTENLYWPCEEVSNEFKFPVSLLFVNK